MLLLNPRIRRRRSRSICPSPNQSRFAAEKRSRGPSTCQAINCREPLTKSCQVPHCHHLHILVLASSLAKASRAASIPPLVLVPSPYTSPPYWFWYLCCYIYHGRCPGRQHALGPSSGGAHGSGGHPATGVPRGSRRIVMSWRWVGKVARASSRPVHPVPLPCVRPPNPKPGAEHRAQAPAPAPASHRAQAKCRPSTSRLPIQAQLGGASVRTHGHDNDFLVGRLGRGRTVHSRPAVCPIIPCPRRVNRSLPMSFSRENDRS
jgi:hypothetical protein